MLIVTNPVTGRDLRGQRLRCWRVVYERKLVYLYAETSIAALDVESILTLSMPCTCYVTVCTAQNCMHTSLSGATRFSSNSGLRTRKPALVLLWVSSIVCVCVCVSCCVFGSCHMLVHRTFKPALVCVCVCVSCCVFGSCQVLVHLHG